MSFSWLRVTGCSGSDEAVSAELVGKAQINEQRKAYITAAEYYARAAEYTPQNTDILISAAENFLLCGENEMFLKYCRMAAENDIQSDIPWVMMGEYFLEKGDAVMAAELLNDVPDEALTDAVYDILSRAKSSFHKGYRTFTEVRPFHDGYCAVKDRDMWGIIDDQGRYCILPEYTEAGAFSAAEDIVPVCRDGIWCFVNSENQIKYVPSEKYTYLGAYASGLAPFCCDGEYGYTDLEYNEKSERYDYAGAFSEGVAAVEKDGRWTVVDENLKNITENEFDMIMTDSYGFCCHGGVIIAVKDGETYALDRSGNYISDRTVFSCGLSPVSCGEFQGYQDEKGDIVIDAFFDEVTDFSENGRAMVKEDGRWKMITLDMYR